MYNMVLNSSFIKYAGRSNNLLEAYFESLLGTPPKGKMVGVPIIGLNEVHDDRSEFWYVRNTAGNRIPFSCVSAVHDDRKVNWYVRNPAGNGVPFLLKRTPLTKSNIN